MTNRRQTRGRTQPAKKPAKKDEDSEEDFEPKEDAEEKDDEEEQEESDFEEDDDDFDDKKKKKKGGKSTQKPAKGGKASKAAKEEPAKKQPAKGKGKAPEPKAADTKGAKGTQSKTKANPKKPAASTKQAPKDMDDDDGPEGGDDRGTILDYMKKQNRPYSLINICDNLHGKIKKKVAERLLDQLASEGELQMKEFGKARIYLYNQKNIPDVDKEELDQMKQDLAKLREEEKKQVEVIKGLNSELAQISSQLTNKQLEEAIEEYKKKIVDMDNKLKFYQSDKYQKISDEDMKKVEDAKIKIEKEYKRRRRICKDALGQMAEGMDKKLSEVAEIIGIDENEE